MFVRPAGPDADGCWQPRTGHLSQDQGSVPVQESGESLRYVRKEFSWPSPAVQLCVLYCAVLTLLYWLSIFCNLNQTY